MTKCVSPQALGWFGAAGSFVLFWAFQLWLVHVAQKSAGNKRHVSIMDLVVSSDDEAYSLSRLQIYMWTCTIIVGFSAVYAATGKVPEIHENLYMLMGVNFASTVAANGINTVKNIRKDPTVPPDFLKDIFFDADASLDLPRTQMFIWTVITIITFFIQLFQSFGGSPHMPEIASGLVVLMGISNGAYLGSKATAPTKPATTNQGAPPVVPQTSPPTAPPIVSPTTDGAQQTDEAP